METTKHTQSLEILTIQSLLEDMDKIISIEVSEEGKGLVQKYTMNKNIFIKEFSLYDFRIIQSLNAKEHLIVSFKLNKEFNMTFKIFNFKVDTFLDL